jgi:hypothetical protein
MSVAVSTSIIKRLEAVGKFVTLLMLDKGTVAEITLQVKERKTREVNFMLCEALPQARSW